MPDPRATLTCSPLSCSSCIPVRSTFGPNSPASCTCSTTDSSTPRSAPTASCRSETSAPAVSPRRPDLTTQRPRGTSGSSRARACSAVPRFRHLHPQDHQQQHPVRRARRSSSATAAAVGSVRLESSSQVGSGRLVMVTEVPPVLCSTCTVAMQASIIIRPRPRYPGLAGDGRHWPLSVTDTNTLRPSASGSSQAYTRTSPSRVGAR